MLLSREDDAATATVYPRPTAGRFPSRPAPEPTEVAEPAEEVPTALTPLILDPLLPILTPTMKYLKGAFRDSLPS